MRTSMQTESTFMEKKKAQVLKTKGCQILSLMTKKYLIVYQNQSNQYETKVFSNNYQNHSKFQPSCKVQIRAFESVCMCKFI